MAVNDANCLMMSQQLLEAVKSFLDALASLDLKLSVSGSVINSPFLQLAHLRVFQIFSFKLSPENNLHLAIFSKVFLLTLLKPLFALDNGFLWDLVFQKKVNSRPTQPSFHWGLCGKSWTLSSKKSSLGALRSSTLWGNLTGYVRLQVYYAQFWGLLSQNSAQYTWIGLWARSLLSANSFFDSFWNCSLYLDCFELGEICCCFF